MTDRLCFVQFPHPGGEHRPDRNDWKNWNVKAHRRKFLRSLGKWRASADLNAAEHKERIVFWGEREPPSRVVATYRPSGPGWPRYLHVPFWQTPPKKGHLQNTDPYVFGNRFRYSNCRQNNKYGPLQTQRLAAGSLILFGSGQAGKFVIDTVFIVGDAQHMSAATVDRLAGVDRVFKAVVCDLLYRGKNKKDHQRLYRGATPGKPEGKMFSYFPCLPEADAPRGFPRPSVRLDGLVNPKNWRALKIKNFDSRNKIEDLWLRITKQVLDQGVHLGVWAATPAKTAGPPVGSSKQGCGTPRIC
jgi:hypothetical protein